MEKRNINTKQHLACNAHIFKLFVQVIKSFSILAVVPPIKEECNKKLTTIDYASDLNVKEDVD